MYALLINYMLPYTFNVYIGEEWKWNWFDFIVVIFSMPIGLFSSGGIAYLRLVRLARLGKLIQRVPAFRIIILGVYMMYIAVAYV